MASGWRLQLLFNHAVPTTQQLLNTTADIDGIQQILRAELDDHSHAAQQWTRDPLGCLPKGRAAIDTQEPLSDDRVKKLAGALDAAWYSCRLYRPLPLTLRPGESFPGTLQLCCFQRLPGLSDETLKRAWLEEHTSVAIETQSTLGYYQNLIVTSGGPHFDGIVEEYFPPEASQSVAAFFAASDDPERLKANVQRMTHSTSRFLDLDATEVVHLTETRIQ